MKKRALHSGFGLVVVVAAVIALAQLASLVPGLRLDLTADHLYTLSDGTKRLLKGIDQPVKAEFFFSAQTAEGVPQIGNYAQHVQEILREYERLSGGRLQVSTIDPEPFSEEEDRAHELGLMSIPIVAGGPEIFFGLALTGASGKTEIVDFFRPDREETLEYDLSQLVWKASRATAPKIALFSSLDVQGGFDFASRQPTPPWAAFAALGQLYDVEALDPDFKKLTDDVRLLLLVHPDNLNENALRAIDRFALNGGAIIVFVDPNAEQAGGGMFGAGPLPESDLKPLFAAWGLAYDPTQVLGDAGLAVPVASKAYGRPVPDVAIQQFGADNMPGDDVITHRLERLHAASAGVLSAAKGSASTFTPVLVSSDQAMLLPASKFGMLEDHTALYEGFRPTGEQYVVAARVTGKIASAFPSAPVAGGNAVAAPAVDAKPANILVVADTDILSNRLWVRVQEFMGQQVAEPFADNGDFLVNAVDSMMGSADLMAIRGRGRYERPFDVVDRIERTAQMDLQAKQQELEGRLQETEARLEELQAKKQQDARAFELDEAQVKELDAFMTQKVRIRKELRDVQHRLGEDIENLGALLKVLNIVVAPLVLVLLLFVLRWRFVRR